MITSVGKEKWLVCMLLVHLCVYLVCITFYLLSFPLDVMGSLRLVIVTLPAIFIHQLPRSLKFSFEPPRDKTKNVVVRPAKTQISLGIRPV